MDLLIDACSAILGQPPESVRPLHGGSLSEIHLLTFPGGARVVAKTGPLVAREATMLRRIAATGAPAPAVLGIRANVLFLEALDEQGASTSGWRALGAGLRKLHACNGDGYGWPEDYAFGNVEIPNAPMPDWPGFWAERRLHPSLPHVPVPLARRIETLAARLPDLLPRHPPPALLHGDLWSGNALFGLDGSAYLIDPACYFGHGEVDLAMLHLFGRPTADFETAYGRPEPGYGTRRAIYQLWPALVHLRLFGSAYLGMVETRLTAVGI